MTPFDIIGTRIGDLTGIRRVRLRADRSKCISCGSCTKNCPMGLDVQKMVARRSMQNDECVLGHSCVDTWPQKVISLGSSSS